MHATYPSRFATVSLALPLLLVLAALTFGSCALGDPGGHNRFGKDATELHIIHADGSGDRVLAVGGPYYSLLLADSTFIACAGVGGLCLGRFTGSAIAPLYPGITWLDCSMSKDRTTVVLTSNVSGPNDLYTMNPDGTSLFKRNVAPGDYFQGMVSPRLDEFVFRRSTGICTMSANGSDLRTIDSSKGKAFLSQERYVDEDRILYSADSGSVKAGPGDFGTTSIVLFDKRTATGKLLVAHHQLGYFSQNVIWGDTLLCVEGGTIKLLDLGTGTVNTVGPGLWASYSPDGTKIVYTDNTRIYILDLHTGVSRVTYTEMDPSKSIEDPEMSPDNTFIVFCADYTVPD